MMGLNGMQAWPCIWDDARYILWFQRKGSTKRKKEKQLFLLFLLFRQHIHQKCDIKLNFFGGHQLIQQKDFLDLFLIFFFGTFPHDEKHFTLYSSSSRMLKGASAGTLNVLYKSEKV